MDQYFSCLPGCQDPNTQQTSELSTSDVKTMPAFAPAVDAASMPEVEDAREEMNPASEVHAEAQEEVRV